MSVEVIPQTTRQGNPIFKDKSMRHITDKNQPGKVRKSASHMNKKISKEANAITSLINVTMCLSYTWLHRIFELGE